MSTLLSIDFDNVPDMTLLTPGDYHFGVDLAEVVVSKAGKDMIKIVLVPVDEPNASAITEYFVLPTQDEDERTRNRKLRRIKDFTKAFSVPNANDVGTWAGSHGWALVSVESDAQYGDKNRIMRYVIAGSGSGSESTSFTPSSSGALPF